MYDESPKATALLIGQLVLTIGALTAVGYGLGPTMKAALVAVSIMLGFIAAIYAGRAWRKRRDRKAEDAWADEVDRVVHTEKVEALGHTQGGLSAPVEGAEPGGLTVATAEPADRLDGLRSRAGRDRGAADVEPER